MKLSLFGVGDAGTRLLNEFVQAEADTGRNFTNGNALAFNTAAETFGEATVIPEERQILIGDTHPEVNQYVDPESDDPASSPGGGDAAPGDGSTAPGGGDAAPVDAGAAPGVAPGRPATVVCRCGVAHHTPVLQR